MKTIVITIDDQSTAKKGYPVSLYLDDGKPDWSDKRRALARALIPLDLTIANPPEDPADNQPLKPENLRKILLSERNASTRFEAVGEYLYRLLLRDKVKDRWDKLSDDYPGEKAQSEGRRVLLDITPKTLRLLPWELMSNGGIPLFLDPLNPMTRGRLKFVTKTISCQWPLHFLIVVGSEEKDPRVQAEEEINSIEEALLKFDTPIEFEILERPSEQELVDTLKRYKPHIFHFIGHGRKGAGVNDPVLAFEAGQSGQAWEWNERMISVDLREWQPRFAFINACRTSTEEAATHSWGLTEAFIRAGVPAVIGMQADVLGAAAAKFPGEIYEALSSDNPPDIALTRARTNVYRLGADGSLRRDWALPTFHISVDPNKVVDMQPPATMKFRSEVNTQFEKIKHFVDRVEPRRKLWRAVEPPSSEAKQLLIIRGIPKSGKTWLVYWCLKSCKWRDLSINYVSLSWKKRPTDGVKNVLDVLRLIIASHQNSQIGQPLPPDAFYKFNALVNHLLDPTEPNPVTIPEGRQVADKGLPFSEGLDDDSIKAMISAFKIALKEATKGRTLVLAIDDVTNRDVRIDHFKNYIVKEFLLPIARGDEGLKDIKIILAVRKDDEELGLTDLENLAVPIDLGWLDRTEMLMFVRYLSIIKRIPPNKRTVVFQASEIASGPTFSPSELENLVTGMAGFLGQ
jgi:hypothetical protein